MGRGRAILGRGHGFRVDSSGSGSLFVMFCIVVVAILLRHWLDVQEENARQRWDYELRSLDTLVGAENGHREVAGHAS